MSEHTRGPVVRSQFVRFLMAGLANTTATLLMFEGLRRVLPYLFAYSLVYALGIVLSYLLNVRYVFRGRESLRTAAVFPLVYAVQYVVGAVTLWVLVGRLGLHPTLAMILVVLLTVPLTYLMSRTILRTRP